MKKITMTIAAIIMAIALSGCVNKALLKSSQAYYDSTRPYMELIIKSNTLSKEEVDSIKLNMSQFKKTLDSYEAEKAWYEF